MSRSLVLATALAALAPIASIAAATPESDAAAPARHMPPQAVQITLPATHGYGIAISGEVHGPHSTVTLSTGKPRPLSSAAYSVAGTITPTRIHASFGKLGSVSLKLVHDKVRRVRLPKSCRLPGSPAVSEVRIGTFVGRVRFHGEHGFTTSSTRRAHGAIGEPTALTLATLPGRHTQVGCLSLEQGGPESRQPITLDASSPDGATTFLAFRDTTDAPVAKPRGAADDPPTTFVAARSEHRGAIEIARTAIASGPAPDFAFDSALTGATVAPPAPFTGTATFERNPDGSTAWSGSLAVSFPGSPDVPLAAPGFAVGLGTGFPTTGESCATSSGDRACASAVAGVRTGPSGPTSILDPLASEAH